MKILSVELAGHGETHDIQIEKGTMARDILDFLQVKQYQVGRKVNGESLEFFEDKEIIYGKVKDKDKLYLVPRPDIDPPFHPEKNIKVIEAENGKVHEVSVEQGDRIEKTLDELGLGEGVFYKETEIQVTLSRVNDLFNDVKEGERLIIFSPSALPNFLNCLQGGDQEL